MYNSTMKVHEIASHSQVTTDAIRHYVKIGLLKPRQDPSNHYKLFGHDDIKRIRFIKQAKLLGYTLTEIREIFSHTDDGHSPCPRVRDIIQSRIIENRVKLEELNALQLRMERALMHWQNMPDGEPDGDSICHLIEGIVDADSFS